MRLPGRRVRRTERLLSLLAVLVAIALIVPAVMLARPRTPAPVTIQILNVSDWHGYVDPVAGVGGAWNLSARWQQDRQAYPTLTLTAGDDIGATPALVGFFDEVPSILAQRLMGIQVNTLGNHNFDRGVAHLQRMINLAGAPTSARAPGRPFKYVSANLKTNGDLKGVDPVAYFNVGGVTVAVIGITNEEAPGLVLPGSFGRVQVTDGVAAANRVAKSARARADAVIVITHKGIRGVTDGRAHGELIDFANALDPKLIDVVVGDHTDLQYSGVHNGILVHENRSFGVTYAKTLLTIQPGVGNGARAGKVLSKSVEFVSPAVNGALGANNTSCKGATRQVPDSDPPVFEPFEPPYCDQAIVDMLVPYRQQLAALLDVPIARTTVPLARGGNIERRQEIPQGSLIADGMRWRYGTQLAFMNGGGIRSALPTCSYTPTDTSLNRATWTSVAVPLTTCPGYGATAPWDIVLGDIFTTLPFGNILNTRTVTGAQLWLALEQGVRAIDAEGNGADGRFPQISGFRFGFRYDIASGCSGSTCTINRIQWVTLSDGTPIPNSSAATYTLTLPNFVNLGGDGYYMFADGQGATQELDAVVMKAYLESLGPTPATRLIDPTTMPLNRIVKCGSASCPAP